MTGVGYRHGLQQPGLRKGFSFIVPSVDVLDLIDRWIECGLSASIDSYSVRLRCPASGHEAALRYLSQILQTTNILLQDIRVPLFERAVLESIRQQGEYTSGQVWIPLPEGFHAKIVDDWMNHAQFLMNRLPVVFSDLKVREATYQEFSAKYVKPWKSRIPGGQSTISVLESAFNQGVAFSHLGRGCYVLGWGAMSQIIDRSANSGDSAIGASLTQNKASAIEVMRAAGIPTPRGVLMRSGEFAPEKIEMLRSPWVIKPVDRDRGEGVVLNIDNISQAKAAFDVASTLSKGVLAEEQVQGTCHRILVVDKKIIYVVKRNPKTIIGDGIHSIADLVGIKNEELRRMIPSKRLPEYSLDEDAIAHLDRINLQPSSVPELGCRVGLRPAQSTRWGGDPEDVTSKLHPENESIAIKAAQIFRLRCAGIDFISQNVGVPWFENGAVINEVNYSPVIGRTHDYQRRAAAAYVKSLFPTKGRIPIEMYLGEDQEASVTERCLYWKSQGMTVKFFSDAVILDGLSDSTSVSVDVGRSVFDSIAMTRFDPTVDVLLLHVSGEELLAWHSLPFPWVTKVEVSNSFYQLIRNTSLWRALEPMIAQGVRGG